MNDPTSGLAQSVRQRLLNRARERDEDFRLTLVRFGVERFLYRLSCSPVVNAFVVKGATLFMVWLEEPYRPTRDLDLASLHPGSREEHEAHLHQIFGQSCPEDGLVFDPESLRFSTIGGPRQDRGLRVKFNALLGSVCIPLQVDIGYGDAIHPPPQTTDFPTLLDLPIPQVKLYPQEALIAEKFEAMVQLGQRNTRYKDFSDVAFLAWTHSFQGSTLLEALEQTFHKRSTAIGPGQPDALRPSYYADSKRNEAWVALAAENPALAGLGSFQEVGRLLIDFLGPLWNALVTNEPWPMEWPPQGPWRESEHG